MGDAVIVIFKIIVTILLSPVIYSAVIAFKGHLDGPLLAYETFLLWGALSFLLAFLFIYPFWAVYEFSQKCLRAMFAFVTPFNTTIARFVPVYMILVLLILFIVRRLGYLANYEHVFLFFAGFFGAMHILLTAQDMQAEEQTAVKPNYFFLMTFVVIVDLSLFILLMDLIIKKLTFPMFLQATYQSSKSIYDWVIHRLMTWH